MHTNDNRVLQRVFYAYVSTMFWKVFILIHIYAIVP